MLEGDSDAKEGVWLTDADLEEEPTKRIARDALYPPPVPREARMASPMPPTPREENVARERMMIMQSRMLRAITNLDARVARLERRMLWLGVAVALAGKVPTDKLIEVAKAIGLTP